MLCVEGHKKCQFCENFDNVLSGRPQVLTDNLVWFDVSMRALSKS